jgi:hypothetical protein
MADLELGSILIVVKPERVFRQFREDSGNNPSPEPHFFRLSFLTKTNPESSFFSSIFSDFLGVKTWQLATQQLQLSPFEVFPQPQRFVDFIDSLTYS